jgi:hypothetical protein
MYFKVQSQKTKVIKNRKINKCYLWGIYIHQNVNGRKIVGFVWGDFLCLNSGLHTY